MRSDTCDGLLDVYIRLVRLYTSEISENFLFSKYIKFICSKVFIFQCLQIGVWSSKSEKLFKLREAFEKHGSSECQWCFFSSHQVIISTVVILLVAVEVSKI